MGYRISQPHRVMRWGAKKAIKLTGKLEAEFDLQRRRRVINQKFRCCCCAHYHAVLRINSDDIHKSYNNPPVAVYDPLKLLCGLHVCMLAKYARWQKSA